MWQALPGISCCYVAIRRKILPSVQYRPQISTRCKWNTISGGFTSENGSSNIKWCVSSGDFYTNQNGYHNNITRGNHDDEDHDNHKNAKKKHGGVDIGGGGGGDNGDGDDNAKKKEDLCINTKWLGLHKQRMLIVIYTPEKTEWSSVWQPWYSRWSLSSTSSVNIRAVILTTFPFHWKTHCEWCSEWE